MTDSARAWILDTAREAVLIDRMTDYGTPEKNFERIAWYWTGLFGVVVEPWQVAAAMVLLKVARLQNNPTHKDSMVDGAGYFACWADVAEGKPDDRTASDK
jgi:Domain of unknown function (DUF6378)